MISTIDIFTHHVQVTIREDPTKFILLWQETPSSSFEYQKQGGEECHFTNNILVLEVLIGFEVGINTLKSTYMWL